MGSGLEASAMAMEYRCGQMELDMKVSGRIIELMVRASSFMWMEIYTKEIG